MVNSGVKILIRISIIIIIYIVDTDIPHIQNNNNQLNFEPDSYQQKDTTLNFDNNYSTDIYYDLTTQSSREDFEDRFTANSYEENDTTDIYQENDTTEKVEHSNNEESTEVKLIH